MATKALLVSLLALWCYNVNALSKNDTTCLNGLPTCRRHFDFALCCPYVGGQCCEDGQHCCPKATECLSSKGMCLSRTPHGIPNIWRLRSYVPLHLQGPRHPPRPELCPTKRLVCPSKSTCCPAPYIGHDCCPLHHAVCCGDFRSCCPTDHSCDLNRGECVGPSGNRTSLYEKLHASRVNMTDNSKKILAFHKDNHRGNTTNVCRDSNALTPTICETHHKCCPSGCCKHTDGVCCADGTTCCPSGTTCANHLCIGTDANVTALLLVKSLPPQQPSTPKTNVLIGIPMHTAYTGKVTLCPGGEYTCPTHMTCCKSGSMGKWGCCPFPNANCCSDNWHCCPQGATCNLIKDRCVRGGLFMPVFRKVEAQRGMVAAAANNWTPAVITGMTNATIVCPDQFVCPDGYTCCQMPNQKYGCCPMEFAVCCSDQVHCCPHGTVCDLAVGGCRKAILHLETLRTFKTDITSPHARVRVPKAECPNSLCPDQSCCKLATGWWGCCAHKEGVCCGDGIHCCPKDNKCDLKTGLCISKNRSTPFYTIVQK